MDYEQFKNYVKASLETITGAQAELFSVKKNNMGRLEGIAVREGGRMASPAIYLEPYYQRYQEGRPFGEIMREMMNFYEYGRRPLSIDPEELKDFANMRTRVIYRLISRQKNASFLEDFPYQKFLDMAVVCCLLFESWDPDRAAAMMVEKEHLKLWDISEEELFCAARENTSVLLPVRLEEFGSYIEKIFEQELEGYIQEKEDHGGRMSEEQKNSAMRRIRERTRYGCREHPVYILGNTKNLYGSSSLLYEGVAEWCREKLGEDYYVIPSSVHELLLLPQRSCPDPGRVRQMIGEINCRHVKPEDVLSDSLYRYRRKMGILEMWEEAVQPSFE